MRVVMSSLAALGLLAACSTAAIPEEQQPTAEQLTSAPWRVISVNGGNAEPGPLTIVFGEGGRASGNSACNQYSAQYQLEDGKLNFGRAISTMKACPEPLMELEQRFLGTLVAVERAELAPDGSLVLHARNEGRIVARRS